MISTLIVVPVNLLIVTLFRKAKLKRNMIKTKKTRHVAKKKFWRRVRAVETVELPEIGEPQRINRLTIDTSQIWTPTQSFVVNDHILESSKTNIAVKKHSSMYFFFNKLNKFYMFYRFTNRI